ncbi:hypothetical protein KHC33_09520 [Methanospirillum sp. J.3.6.1-F.2.7.3]|uniref:DUF155 domain-containing protein n=1 Tax=Methanospirillum purgamenti TaxID=2834276 RepID=A0A8E7AZL1_9EURY|nr:MULTISPECIES: hypothetical protein [Methanospirillum]MDX8551030.1 hypothetical protein [Methanospirillum hungatei]QVV87606.1 hypothetical protein KHC33_09520 [Methanospirillum sp. J.3.6.1-F.2.7.3]
MDAIRFFRIYDIGREIDIQNLETALARSYYTARTNFQRIKPKSIRIEDPPLLLRMHPTEVIISGLRYDLQVSARIFDIGAISICFVYEIDESKNDISFEETGLSFFNDEIISDLFSSHLTTLKEILRPHITDIQIDETFFEDYFIFFTDNPDKPIDEAVLLLGERTRFSHQMREEILKNSMSYTDDDVTILSWGAALLKNREVPTDLFDLIEYANVQVLELRYYDQELSRKMEKMYDDIELADRSTWLSRMRLYHQIMADLMELHAEVSEITEKVNNLIKVTEDVYYARVYATALKVLRSQLWSDSVNRKIEVIQENYAMLSDEVRIQHSNFLEWVIIILITMEFVLAMWEFIW